MAYGCKGYNVSTKEKQRRDNVVKETNIGLLLQYPSRDFLIRIQIWYFVTNEFPTTVIIEVVDDRLSVMVIGN